MYTQIPKMCYTDSLTMFMEQNYMKTDVYRKS